jgi:hypothetical protein
MSKQSMLNQLDRTNLTGGFAKAAPVSGLLRALFRSYLPLMAVLSLALVPLGAQPQVVNSDTPFFISPSASVDENLFLVRLLDEIYASWPDNHASSQQLTDWVATTRQITTSVRDLVQPRRLDPDVAVLYDDCLRFLADYETFLTNVGMIQTQRNGQAVGDVLRSAKKGIDNGSDAKSIAGTLGASSSDADDFGKVIGWMTGLADLYARNQQHDAAQKAAVQEELRKLSDSRVRTDANARHLVDKLMRTHGWGAGEAGFDNFRGQYPIDYVRRRPRDPFAKERFAMSLADDGKSADILAGADACIEAAELVPGGNAYDAFRVEYLLDAATLAVSAASTEAGSGGYSSGPTPSTPYALRVARTYLAADESDTMGQGHALLARALALSRRYPEAVDAANAAYTHAPNLSNDASYCYRYAALMSLTNSLDLAGDWLARAYANGLKDVDYIRNAADFVNFRRGRAARYAELTTVKVTYWVDFGIFNDDIVLENKSPFELTNVHAQVTIRKGQQTWQPQVECKSIKAGASCRAVNVVSIPGSAYDEAHATVDCDQNVH